jgi:hypothetical protein
MIFVGGNLISFCDFYSVVCFVVHVTMYVGCVAYIIFSGRVMELGRILFFLTFLGFCNVLGTSRDIIVSVVTKLEIGRSRV